MSVVDAAGSDWERRHALVSALASQAEEDDSWLQAWLAAEPDNPIALSAYAKTLSTTAFAIRTTSRAEDVASDQWEAFFRVLRQAPEHCLHAAEVAPEDPTPWVVLQTIALGLQYDNDEYRKVFGEVVCAFWKEEPSLRQVLHMVEANDIYVVPNLDRKSVV